jgi:heme exporter protein A
VPDQASPALDVDGLTRRFGHVHALRGISFTLETGDALAIFGPNGAGKTTLLRMLAGILRPDTGTIRIAGAPLVRGDATQRRRIGLISHQSLCYDGLTAAENLQFYGRLYGLERPAERAMAALEGVGLADRSTTTAATMSRGMLQRLAIARALLHDPEIVLLDEPFTGLDQRAAGALRAQLEGLRAQHRTIVIVTHNLDEGLELASHVAIQLAGRFAEYGARSGELAAYRARYAEVTGG